MDIQQQNSSNLEPIQEESEQEDETEERKTGEEQEEEEDFQVQVGMETEEVMAEDESEEDEDDDAPLRVLSPGQLSSFLSRESLPRMQSTINHLEEMENFSVSDQSTFAVDLSDEATPPAKPRFEFKKRPSSGELRIKVSKTRWQKHEPPQQKKQKKTNSKIKKRASLADEPFPQWLVELMVNIEEATTHQLVVE